jgi:hypothetical protein
MVWGGKMLPHWSAPRRVHMPTKPKRKPRKTLRGTVEKIIKPVDPGLPEKAQIDVDGADDLYKEIRIENKLTDEKGDEVQLKQGAGVEVTVEAEPEATTKSGKAP